MIHDLPAVKPGEFGLRWFGYATNELNETGKNITGKVKLILHILPPTAPKELKIGGENVEMIFLKVTEEPIYENTMVGATRDAVGNLVIDFIECQN